MATSIESKFAELKRHQLDQWREWAQTIADGGPTPTPTAILEAGAVLSIDGPMEALRADADAILEVKAIEDDVARYRARVAEQLAPYGGTEAALRQRIAEYSAELIRMKALAGPEKHLEAGRLSGEAGRLRAKHPRVFPAGEPVAKSTTKRKAVPA